VHRELGLKRGHPPRKWLTVIALRLGPGGELEALRVVRSSGLPKLDEEALRACRAAAPFGKPPAPVVGRGLRMRLLFDESDPWNLEPAR
jgi:TonB family protein